uniref:Uncharacterized protein n=1 Tax=Ditylenchus dipsaci TaxID=166011 RepID=A0A915E463_9BILA
MFAGQLVPISDDEDEEQHRDCLQLCLASKIVFSCANKQIHQIYKKREKEKKQLRQRIVQELDSINRITSLNIIQKILSMRFWRR